MNMIQTSLQLPSMPRQILVTSALPYGNAAIHLGTMLEAIQSDIWVRYYKLMGHECYYICADDAHGTPIMLSAEKAGISPQEHIDKMQASHIADYQGFLIDHDNYHSTHSDENRELVYSIYQTLFDNKAINTKVIKQAFDPEKEMFLPDRFVKGECPKCGTKEQYGDNCENCGATYDPTELVNPYSIVSGATPIEKDSEQYFFDLPQFESFLKEWLAAGHTQPEISNKMQEWFEDGLHPWDISRNAPYWGFEIPNAPGKYFYVWLDAPIGYMASFKNFCDKKGLDFDQFWNADSQAELYHIIGKDIARFHTLFWPAVLHHAGYRTPNGVYCHGFVTVDGQKMSKSRGTFIQAATYLKHLEPEYLRYFYASRLNASIEDLDLNLEDFQQKVNSDLVGKVVNIASRNAGFIRKRYGNILADTLDQPELFAQSIEVANQVSELYEQRQFSSAMREIMAYADIVNQYIDDKKPWQMAKDESLTVETQQVCTTGLNLFKQLMIMLTPVLPKIAAESQRFLNVDPWTWADLNTQLLGHKINNFKPLLNRIESSQLESVIEDTKAALQETPAAKEDDKKAQATTSDDSNAAAKDNGYISIDDFSKVDLRVAKVIEAEPVPEADKLLKLIVDAGEGRTRQIFAGIKQHVSPEQLIGKSVVIVANLAPRKMRFGLSEGMMLCAADGDKLFTIHPQEEATAGMQVR
jgi:methionyl-tRNA synthetase